MPISITTLSIVTETPVCQAKIIGFTAQQTTLSIKVVYSIPFRPYTFVFEFSEIKYKKGRKLEVNLSANFEFWL
jgi:hypothetical protein